MAKMFAGKTKQLNAIQTTPSVQNAELLFKNTRNIFKSLLLKFENLRSLTEIGVKAFVG